MTAQWATNLAGSGATLTDLNGASIRPGTVAWHQLSPETWQQATQQVAGSIAQLNGRGTNTTLSKPLVADQLFVGESGSFFAPNPYGVVLVSTSVWPRLGFSMTTDPSLISITDGPLIGWEPNHPNGGELHLTRLAADILDYVLDAALIHFEHESPSYHLTVGDIAACFGKQPGQVFFLGDAKRPVGYGPAPDTVYSDVDGACSTIGP